MSATARKQAPRIAQEASLGAPATDSIYGFDDVARWAAAIREGRDPDPWKAFIRWFDAEAPTLRGSGLSVWCWLLRNTAYWWRWTLPNDKRPQPIVLGDIAQAIGYTRSAVCKGIAQIEDQGRVYVERISPAGSGEKAGARYTLLLPEAESAANRKAPPQAIGQQHLDAPHWLKEELTALGEPFGVSLLPAANLVMDEQRKSGLTDREMVLWLKAAGATLPNARKNPVALFRVALGNMLQERGELRTPAEQKAPSKREPKQDPIAAIEREQLQRAIEEGPRPKSEAQIAKTKATMERLQRAAAAAQRRQ